MKFSWNNIAKVAVCTSVGVSAAALLINTVYDRKYELKYRTARPTAKSSSSKKSGKKKK